MQSLTQSAPRLALATSVGQRTGNEQYEPKSTQHGFHSTSHQQSQKNTITLPYSELVKLKEKCIIGMDPERERKMQEKLELYQKSMSRVQNWPNTIYALRKRKDDARFERFCKAEEERRRIDEDEAQYQQKIKKDIIERANRQIYETTDRVKAFYGKMLMSDALQEREEQLLVNQSLREMDKVREQMFVEQQKEAIQRLEMEEEKKKLEFLERKRQAQVVLKQQHDEMKTNYIKKIQDEKIEGEMIKIKAEEALAEQQALEKQRRERNMKLQEEIKQGNELLKTMKEEKKLKEIAEEQKIQQHAEKKERISEMKRLREEQKFKEKMEQRQKMIDLQIKKLQEMKSEEDKRINNQIKEAEIKAELAEQKKQLYRTELQKRIDESLRLTTIRKEQWAKREKEEDEDFQNYWIKKNVQIQEKEHKDKQEQRERQKELQQYHSKQIAEKEKERERHLISELEQAELIKGQKEQEDKNFESWAARAIDEWKSDGKNIYPMLKELKDYRKKVQ